MRLLYFLTARPTDPTRAGQYVMDRLACRRLVTLFSQLFHGGDAAELVVSCMDPADLPAVEAWARWAGRHNGYGDPPSVLVGFAGELDAHAMEGAVVMDSTTHYTEEGLFRAYDAGQGAAGFAYETDEATDLYDLDLLVEMRRYNPRFEGSVYLNAPRKPRYREYLAWLAARGGRARILDVGCGAGALYGLLSRWSRETGHALPAYLGLDYSRTHVLRARRAYPEASFRWGSLAALDAWPGQFDACMATSVFNFIPAESQLQGLERTLTAASGRLFTTIHTARAERYAPIPAAVEYDFFGRRMPSCHASYEAVRAVLERFPGSVAEETRGLCGYRRAAPAGLVERVEIPVEDEDALRARALPDAEVAAALRAKHGLAEDEGPFETANLAIWPTDAIGLPPASNLPDDLYTERVD